MNSALSFLFALLAVFAAGCAGSGPCESPARESGRPETSVDRPAAQEPAPAPAAAKAVGFDLDDTLLFSTPAFARGFAAEGVKAYSARFWEIVNSSDEKESGIKERAREILEKHKAEGARIFVVTSRHGNGGETLKKYLFKIFGIPPEMVFFETGGKEKRIRELGLEIYYGDSDSDIEAARKAGAKGIRILRSKKSSYKGKFNPGKFGEEIVPGSED